jgi:predicted Zn-dependent protease
MHERFYRIADHVVSRLESNEVALMTYSGEDSDFVRFNHNAVRQAGAVAQQDLSIDLIDGQRHAEGGIVLTGDFATDSKRADAMVADLRGRLPHLPEDPHLLYSTEVHSTEKHAVSQLAPAETALGEFLECGKGKDAVGIYAQGPIYRGFANSLGQRNWFCSYSFNLGWCFYLHDDKAVKARYAGFEWKNAELRRHMDDAARQLTLLDQAPKTIERGAYRVYLAPPAVKEVIGLLSWSGFGLKDHRSKISSLLRMTEGEATLNPAVTMSENTGEGVSPNFDDRGFVKPDRVDMIAQGRFKQALVSPRSAKEYGVPTNAANGYEAPDSFDMAAGDIPDDEILKRIGTGLYINNLWYLNYSDRPGCRMTGMTRFATFWVEKGALAAPVNVMRFDESIYRMFGEQLVGLTRDRSMILASETYGGRSVGSHRLPGALVEDFTLTL